MKRLFLLSLLLLSIGLHSYICWEEDGKAIRQESNLNFTGSVIQLSDGNLLAMWSDASGGTQEMKVQKVTDEGEVIWDEPVILTTRECYYPDGEVLTESINGDIVTAWHELDNPALIRAQRIDADGNLLWGDEGIIIELNAEASCFPLHVISDETGGAYLVWMKWGNPPYVRAVYLEESGEIGEGWDSGGTAIMTGGSYLMAIADGYGGLVVMTKENGIGHLQRCDSQGNLYWGAEGSVINDCVGYNFDLLPWSEGEYAVLMRTANSFSANVINLDGEILFEEMQPVITFEEEDYIGNFEAAITSDGKLCLACDLIASNCIKLVVQKGNIGEESDWGETGITIEETEGYYYFYEPKIASDTEGGIYISWKCYLEEEDENEIYYQHLDSDGNVAGGAEPEILCDSYILEPGIIISGDEGPAMFWYTEKGGSQEIRYQIFDSEDNALLAEEGNSLHSVLAGTTRNPGQLVTNSELTAVFWEDTRMDLNQVYVQLLDNNSGELLFAENGIPVTMDCEQKEEDPAISISEDGESICVVYKIRTLDQDYWGIQIFDPEGNRLLGENGQQLNELFAYSEISITSTEDNGFLIAWVEWNSDFVEPVWNIQVQKIIGDEFVWGNGVSLVSESDHDAGQISLCENRLAWVEDIWGTNKLRISSLEEDGSITPGWDEEGLIITEQYSMYSTRIYEDGEDMIIFWDGRVTENSSRNLCAQKVSAEGELLWEEDGRIICEDSAQISSYGLHNDYIYCVLMRNVAELTLNKYDLEGNVLWDEGVMIDDSFFSWKIPLTFYEDKIIVYWTYQSRDIYAKIFNEDGSLIDNIPPEGLIVCDQQHVQEALSCLTDENGSSIVLWKDTRGEYYLEGDPSLYVQKLDLSALPSYDDEIFDGNLVNMTNYPNPFMQSTTLKCDLPRNLEDAEIVIYNIRGQKVRSIPATSNEVEWDCRNQAGNIAGSGVYFYVLQGKNIKSETGKMIMLR